MTYIRRDIEPTEAMRLAVQRRWDISGLNLDKICRDVLAAAPPVEVTDDILLIACRAYAKSCGSVYKEAMRAALKAALGESK